MSTAHSSLLRCVLYDFPNCGEPTAGVVGVVATQLFGEFLVCRTVCGDSDDNDNVSSGFLSMISGATSFAIGDGAMDFIDWLAVTFEVVILLSAFNCSSLICNCSNTSVISFCKWIKKT